MQTRLKLFIFIFVLFFTATDSLAKEYDFRSSIALVGMSMDYREYNDNGVILDSEKSSFNDVTGFETAMEFYFLKGESFYSQVDVDLLLVNGETEYVGALLSSTEGYGSYISKTYNSVIDIDATYRSNHIINESLEFSYGLGLGFRYWKRSLSSTQEEAYYWLSLRPSIGLDIKPFEGFSIAPVVEYQYGILPTMYENTFDHNFKLGSADIIEFSLPLTYALNDTMDIFFVYTYQLQEITKSEVIQREYSGSTHYIWEPDSTANNQYLKFGMAFKY
jgi:hypothetical protein